MKTLVNDLVKTLIQKNMTIALAESMTCGLATHQLNIVKGTSEILMGSVICYNENVKTNLLNVPKTLIEKYTAESREVTDQLALNLGKLIKADLYAAITGLATADGSETKEKPVGTVFFTLKKGNKLSRLQKRFYGSPMEIKKKACETLYKMILQLLEGK